ncbi:MAG TPA: response regulator transcription factor [Terracidiphilus sp.]|jgi:DNA-binding NarL/FixJ family response regulator
MAGIDVVLADDQPLSLLGMRSAVADQRDIRILAECQDPHDLAEAVRHQPPDVLLVNASLLRDELGPLKQLVSQNHKTHVIVITTHTDPGFLDQAMRCGAKGVIQTARPVEEIPTAIRKVTSGGVWRERFAA